MMMATSYEQQPVEGPLDKQIIAALTTLGPMTRQELCEFLHVSRTTLSKSLDMLLSEHAVDGYTETAKGRGRPVERFHVKTAVVYAIGIDISRVRAMAMAVNRAGKVLATVYCDAPENQQQILDTVDSLCAGLAHEIERHHCEAAHIQFVGAGIPKPVASGDHPWHSVTVELAQHLETIIQRYWQAPVVIDNSVRMAALGEVSCGAGSEGGVQLYVRIAGGIVACNLVDDIVEVGAYGLAGELGHVTIRGVDNRCTCGKTGCAETIAALPAVLAAAEVTSIDELNQQLASDPPDGKALAAIDQSATAVAEAIGNAILLTNPQRLILAGELPLAVTGYTELLRERLQPHLIPGLHKNLQIVTAQLGDEGSITGAIAAAERFTGGPSYRLQVWRLTTTSPPPTDKEPAR